MNQNSIWTVLLVVIVVAVSSLVALPNIFGKAPSIQVSRDDGVKLTEAGISQIVALLDSASVTYTDKYVDDGWLIVQFASSEQQTKASQVLREGLGKGSIIALALAPKLPAWMRTLRLKTLSLGLDLRGGVHLLFEVDMDAAISQRLEMISTDINRKLREARIRRNVRVADNEVRVRVGDAADLSRAEEIIRDTDDPYEISRSTIAGEEQLVIRLTEQQVRERQDFAIEQNTVTMRNRVNALGVSEPVVQRQGINRIVVQLPGIEDPAQAERILDATATLEFRLVCDGENAFEAQRRGRPPLGCELFNDRQGSPVLLKRGAIVTGDQLVDASQGFAEGAPAVLVNLDSSGADEMLRTTRENVGKPMAVLFVEQSREIIQRDGKDVPVTRTDREVINVATIQGIFSSRFQITGLDVVEARDLSLLLRAGALSAPVYKVEERTIGPSLGQENIDRGFMAILIGVIAVVLYMAVYYKVFGIIADIAVLMNVILLIAVMSLLEASLTMPGIAGIVLTVGMAVDSNVLIFERIREELRNGNSPQASIQAGYDKAFATITDSNITTLIAGLVLFAFGTGPVKGFAITLSVGILTSMFTSVVGSRVLVNWLYGGRQIKRLPI